MERSLWGALAGALLGISTLGAGALGGGGGAIGGGGGASPGGPRDVIDGWSLLQPVTYENISIFPVVASGNVDTSGFLTLDEGLSSGEVLVSEQGADGMARSRDGRPSQSYASGASVNQLVLINRSKRPLILLAGELVSGGKQDRIIGKDRVVPAGASPLPLDVFCVEHGRWSAGSSFGSAKSIVHPSVREQAAVAKNQNEVWSAVRSGSTSVAGQAAGSVTSANSAPAPRLSARSIDATIAAVAPTQSYDKIYNSSSAGRSVDSFAEEVQRRFAKATSGLKDEHVVGVIVAYGGEVAWSDIFASYQLFESYWPKLLRSYAVEALARPTLREVASHEDAREFLQNLRGHERQENEPGAYKWVETSVGKLTQIELSAIDPKPFLLHRLLLRRTS